MNIRPLKEIDKPFLERWHREAGFDYPLPDLSGPLFDVLVVVDENDIPVQAIAAKKTAEMFLLLDPHWKNPRWRLEALMQGHEAMREKLHADGIDDVIAFLPPEVEKSFGRRLTKIFGWIPGRWKHYSRRTGEPLDV